MSPLLLVAIALITYGSRAAAVVLLPRPGARFETVLSRIPAAIFGGLATATLLGEGAHAGRPAHPGRRRRRAGRHPGALAAALPGRRRDRLRGGRAARLSAPGTLSGGRARCP